MIHLPPPYQRLLTLSLLVFIFSCNNAKGPGDKDLASTPEELNRKVSADIQALLQRGDSLSLYHAALVEKAYTLHQYAPVWSLSQQWQPRGDSLLAFIASSKRYGLFPEDYHAPLLDSIQRLFAADTLARGDRRNAVLWSRAEIALTDAFFRIVKDVHFGRLEQDSVSQRRDSVFTDDDYLQQLNLAKMDRPLSKLIRSLEPDHTAYHQLRAAIPEFLQRASEKAYTVVPSPKPGGPEFKALLQKRLYEGGYITYDSIPADSASLADAVKKFQKEKGITIDGKAGEGTVRMLNTSDKDRFVHIAITLDRYKLLPEKMPERYIWVNIPAYYMELKENDTVSIRSRIIVGKAVTRTPLLTSSISELVTYPQWTIPTSIIVKEILPAVKRNPEYLAKKGYSLVDQNGDVIDPYSVDWSKYSKGIPYKVVQGSGDDNALGILKFNFPNKYAVYLHDTNQRYLFGQAMRSLSHGCVRVQSWKELAYSIIRYDNREKYAGKKSPAEDSLGTWLSRKVKKHIPVRKRLPVYIRYFTCEEKDGIIQFYDDIYGEDKYLRGKYFAGK